MEKEQFHVVLTTFHSSQFRTSHILKAGIAKAILPRALSRSAVGIRIVSYGLSTAAVFLGTQNLMCHQLTSLSNPGNEACNFFTSISCLSHCLLGSESSSYVKKKVPTRFNINYNYKNRRKLHQYC